MKPWRSRPSRMLLKSLLSGSLCSVIAFGSTRTADAAGIGQSCGGATGIICDHGLWCDLTCH